MSEKERERERGRERESERGEAGSEYIYSGLEGSFPDAPVAFFTLLAQGKQGGKMNRGRKT